MTTLRSAHGASRRSQAFTLVEILIVVIILGILAAIVIPQFANASTDARKANMVSQLQSLRSFVELYRLQHRDQPPLLLTGGGWDLVTGKTLQNGTVDPTGEFGPYMPNPAVNPLTNSSVIAELGATSGPNVGWYYDEATGEVHGANSVGEMSDTGT